MNTQKFFTKKAFLFSAVILLISGFFVVKLVLAVSIFNVAIDTPAVDVGQTKSVSFTVNSTGADNIKTVAISIQGTGFSNPTSFVCPANWNQIAAMPPILNGYVCNDPSGAGLASAVVTLDGLTAPATAGTQNFSVSAINTNASPQTDNQSVVVTVKNLAATATIESTTNINQNKIYTLTLTNSASDPGDSINQVSGTLSDFSIATCEAAGWSSCVPSGGSFVLSGGALAPGASLPIALTATAPSTSGARLVDATINGVLGATTFVTVTPSTIQVQTPANLSAENITTDKARVSRNSGAYNTANISVTVNNTGEATANTLVKSLIIKDNGGTDISSQFTISETDTVTSIAGGSSGALTWTVTAKEGTAEDLDQAEISVGYNDINTGVAGEAGPASQTNDGIFTVDNTNPILTTATTVSNNTNTTRAKVGDAITLTFISNENIQTPVVAIAGHSVAPTQVSDTQNWSATYTMQSSDTEGTVPFSITPTDIAGNTAAAVSATTDGSNVTFDETAPTFSSIAANPTPAKSTGLITVTFTASETLLTDPEVTIGGKNAAKDETGAGLNYIYKRTLDGTETEGTAAVAISGADLTGNIGTDTTSSIITDFHAPTTSDDAPSAWQNDDVTVTLTPTDQNPSSGLAWTKYCTDDGTTPCNPSAGNSYSEPVVISTVGTSYFRYASRDMAGNLQATVSKTILIDKTGPSSAVITYPSANSYLKNSVTITATATDNEGGSGIAKVEFYYSTTETKIGEDLVGPAYSMDWATPAGEGDHDIYVKVYDNANNIKASNHIAVHTDNTPPTIITFTMTVNGSGATTGNVSFSPNADGVKDDVGVDTRFSEDVQAYIKIKNNLGGIVKILYTSSGYVENPTSYSWDGKNDNGVMMADGVYTVEVKGVDHAGNEVINNSRTITLDNTAPIVNAGDDKTANTTITQTGATVENGSGIASVLWSKTSGDGNITFGTPTTLETTIAADADGTYILKLEVTDNAGNKSSDTMNLILDTQNPTIDSYTEPELDKVYKNGTIDVAFTPNDTGTAVTCTYQVNSDAGPSGTIACTAGSAVDTTISGLSDGRHTITITVADAAGNSTAEASNSFAVDTNNTLTVGAEGADFTTIQAAIDAATSGDTISVAAGTYAGEITVDKSLAIRGANAGVAGNATRGAESIIDGNDAINPVDKGFIVAAGNLTVTIDGFKFTDNSPLHDNYAGGAHQTTDLTFTNNIVSSGNALQTTETTSNWKNVSVTFNKFENIDMESNSSAVYLAYNKNSVVTDNVFSSINYAAVLLISNDTATVSRNTITTTGQQAIQLAGTMGDSTVSDNVISGANTANAADKGGIRLYGDEFTGTVNVTGNTISNSFNGVAIANGKNITGKDIHVNSNNLAGNSNKGVYHGGTGTLDATENWWGTTDSAAIASLISGTVDYRPWYLSDALTGLDSTAPTVALTYSVNPAKAGSMAITATYSEAIAGTPQVSIGQPGTTDITNADMTATSGMDNKVWTYSYTVNTANGSTYVDGTATVSLSSINDPSGNLAANPTNNSFTIDTTSMDAPVITHIAGDEFINNSEKNAIIVTGTAEANSLVTVSLTSGETVSGTQQLSGGGASFSITIDGTNLTDGIVTPSVTATDAAGNVSVADTAPTALKDTVAPVITTVDGVSATPTQTDTINLTVTEANLSTSLYGYSADSTCNASDTINTAFISATNFSISGDYTDYLCAMAADTSGNETYELIGQLVTDNTDPALTLNSMFTDQTLTGGNSYPISWTASDDHLGDAPVTLEYSINGGVTWAPINTNPMGNDGSESWTVPNVNSSNCYIRAIVTDQAGNDYEEESSNFSVTYSTVTDTSAPVAALNSPNGGETWENDAAHIITWTATDNITAAASLKIKLEYSVNGGDSWVQIANDETNDGAYAWTPTGISSSNAMVKVTATDAANLIGSDISNTALTIAIPAAYPSSICTGSGPYTCTIELSSGWNLISLPVIPSETAIERVLDGIKNKIDTVRYYDSTLADDWLSAAVLDNAFIGDLTAIADGKGYWISMDAPATLTVTGTAAPVAPDPPSTYSVISGWNLIGYKSTSPWQDTTDYLSTLSTGYIVFDQNNTNKTSSYIQQGKGYWLWSAGSGSIVPND
ncbi:MAG: right-handed parallel beta-helix repeat-containing protein [bacterium]|nr:right-handed parallel beta-helix repeat-containing protein [bacterium]